MSEEVTKAIIEKANRHEEEIQEIKFRLQQESVAIEIVKELKPKVDELIATLKNLKFPEFEMKQLSTNLKTGIAILKEPVTNNVVHHHHFPKISFITAGLFLVVCILSTGWYMTGKTINEYKDNDTKWRYFKLLNNESVQRLANVIDTLSVQSSNFRDSVIQAESNLLKQRELKKQIEEKEEEVKDLKRKKENLENK